MGLFFYTKIGSIISIGDLPTTNIIEPKYAKNLNQNDRGFFEASSSIKTSSIAFFIFGAKGNNVSTSDCSLVPRGF